MSDLRYSMTVRLIDHITAPAKKAAQGLQRLTATGQRLRGIGGRVMETSGLDQVAGAVGNVGGRFREAAGEAGRLGLKIAAISGAGAWLFKRELLDTAAAFETFQAVLETTEGSATKARKSMSWISDFAATTPFGLEEVTDGFVKLRSYGLDPTSGLLRTLGDTAAAMTRPIGQAVEAIADAVTGENERLKEFGITARQAGNKVVYSYTVNGQQMKAVAQANNRAMIQSTLEGIWNEKFGGAMKKMATTYNGMLSNIGDQWLRFKMMVMDAGAFDFIKGKLSDLLAKVDAMASSGELRALADSFGKKLVRGLEAAWEAGVALTKVLAGLGGVLSRVAGVLGGWENLGIALASLVGVKLVVALGSLTVAVGQFGLALLTTPVGWFLGAVAAIAGVAYAIYRNWSKIGDYFRSLWGGVRAAFEEGFINGVVAGLMAFNPLNILADAVNGMMKWLFGIDLRAIGNQWISDLVAGLTDALPSLTSIRDKIVSVLPDLITKRLGIGVDAEGQTAAGTPTPHPRRLTARGRPLAASGANLPAPAPRQNVQPARTDVGGRIEVVVSQEGPPRIRRLETRNPDVDLEASTGPMMLSQ